MNIARPLSCEPQQRRGRVAFPATCEIGDPLFHDHRRVAVGARDPLARHRRITLADLQYKHWILSRNELMPGTPVVTAFADAGVPFPQHVITSGSLDMRQLASGRFVTCLPHSLLPFIRLDGNYHVLPIELPPWETATMIMTLRGRAMPPVVEGFLETLRGWRGRCA